MISTLTSRRELAERINKTVKENNDKYLESMDLRKSNQLKIDKLRHFKIGDKVTLRKLTGNKTIDKLVCTQHGSISQSPQLRILE